MRGNVCHTSHVTHGFKTLQLIRGVCINLFIYLSVTCVTCVTGLYPCGLPMSHIPPQMCDKSPLCVTTPRKIILLTDLRSFLRVRQQPVPGRTRTSAGCSHDCHVRPALVSFQKTSLFVSDNKGGCSHEYAT